MKTIIKNTQKGFTLVELMVVIAIIAILAAVAIPMYSNYVNKARISTALGNIGTLKVNIAEQNTNSNPTEGGILTGVLAVDNPAVTDNGATYTTTVKVGTGDIKMAFTAPVTGDITMVPTITGSGSIIKWTCTAANFPSDGVLPSSCPLSI